MQSQNQEQNQLRKSALDCSGCLDWLHNCQAECCKSFAIKIAIDNHPRRLQPGDTILFTPHREITDDLAMYYYLHDCQRIRENTFEIKLNNFLVRKGMLIVLKKCQWLGQDNKCMNYEDRPQLCRELNQDTYHNGRYLRTPNCMYRWQGRS